MTRPNSSRVAVRKTGIARPSGHNYKIKGVKEVCIVYDTDTYGRLILHCICEKYTTACDIAKQNINYSLSIVEAILLENNVWYVPCAEVGQQNSLLINDKGYVPCFILEPAAQEP